MSIKQDRAELIHLIQAIDEPEKMELVLDFAQWIQSGNDPEQFVSKKYMTECAAYHGKD